MPKAKSTTLKIYKDALMKRAREIAIAGECLGWMDRRQLADEGRKLRPDLPVLFTSGYTPDGIVRHGRLEHGVALLRKPYRRGIWQ